MVEVAIAQLSVELVGGDVTLDEVVSGPFETVEIECRTRRQRCMRLRAR